MRYLSLFDGIGAVHVAWRPLGWQCVGTCEIEPFPAAVVEHHHGFPNLGDVTRVTDEQIAALGPIDLVVGGSPCQDLSVAGKRAGLAGARSGLFHEQMRIFDAARAHCGARWLLWENVPGAFSTHKGRDFAVVVGTLAGCEFGVPRDGWRNAGAAVGPNGLVEWTVLDAQFFGVAQRRRRVFAVLDTGNWQDRSPVLLEPPRLSGHFAPRREAREATPGTIGARTCRSIGADDAANGHLIPAPHADISPAIKARDAKGASSDGDGDGDGAILVPMVAHSLRAEGFDASEDGTGRGTPLVPVGVTIHGTDKTARVASYTDVAGALRARTPGAQENSSTTVVQQPVAFSCKDHGADAADIAPTLRSMGHADSHANGGGQVAVAFGWQNSSQQGASASASASVTPTLDKSKVPAVAFHENQRAEVTINDTAGSLKCNGGKPGQGYPATLHGMQVRRLTPRECERLQGFPDDYTAITYRGKPAADGPRYKALGNSMAVPVMRWIGQQLDRAASAQDRAA